MRNTSFFAAGTSNLLYSGMQNMQTKDTHIHLHERDDIAECLSKGKVAKNENTDYLKNGRLLENCEICWSFLQKKMPVGIFVLIV